MWNIKKDCALFHVEQNLTMSYPVFLLPQTIPACVSCSMRGASVVDTQEEYDTWLASQKPQFLTAHPDGVPPAAKTAEAPGQEGKPVAQAEAH